jgi:ribonuclease HI
MEIMAAIVGLESLKVPCRVMLHSDSKYVVNAMTLGWVQRWRANGWKRNKTDLAVNVDLWERLLAACARHEVTFRWVKGHAGRRDNETCDRLANAAAIRKDLPVDEGYVRARRSGARSTDFL